MNEQISNKVLKMIEDAAEKGEEGINVLIEKFPSVLEGYVNWLLFDAIFSFLFIGILIAFLAITSRFCYKKFLENPPKNSWDTNPWQIGLIISSIFLTASLIILAGTTALNVKRFGHFKLSPATAVYKEFVMDKN